MRISARCGYACKALTELALHWPDKEPLHITDISKRQSIPLRYLVQILIQLKREGIVESVRGRSGGYILALDPVNITLGNIVRLTSGPLLSVALSSLKEEALFGDIWSEAEDAMATVLNSITFADIKNKAEKALVTLNYQI